MERWFFPIDFVPHKFEYQLACTLCGYPQPGRTGTEDDWAAQAHRRPCKLCKYVGPPRIQLKFYKRRKFMLRQHSVLYEDSRAAATARVKLVRHVRQRLGRIMPRGEVPSEHAMLRGMFDPGIGTLKELPGDKDVVSLVNKPEYDEWHSFVALLSHEEYADFQGHRVRDRMSQKKMAQFRLPEDLHKWFKSYCAKHGVSMTDVLVDYLNRLRELEETEAGVELL